MKKLSLDQLEVENFASQPSEEELANVKGGTTPACAVAAVAAAAIYAGTEVYKAYKEANYVPPTKIERSWKEYDAVKGDTVNVDSTYYFSPGS